MAALMTQDLSRPERLDVRRGLSGSTYQTDRICRPDRFVNCQSQASTSSFEWGEPDLTSDQLELLEPSDDRVEWHD